MKKYILIIAAAFTVCLCSAQNDTSYTYTYCEIVGTGKIFNPNKVTVVVDYGESESIWDDKRIRDEETGKVQTFNSMVDALNYMGSKSWEFCQAYAVSASSGNVYHWLLKKKVKKK